MKNSELIIQLEKALEKNSKKLEILQSERSEIQTEGFALRMKNDKPYFYEKIDSVEKGINKNPERVVQITRAEFLDLQIADIEIECEQIKVMLETLHNNYEKGRLGIRKQRIRRILASKHFDRTSITLTPWQKSFVDGVSMNPLYPENLIYATSRGVMVRTKSEQGIGNRLEARGVPYHYERELIVDVTELEDVKGYFVKNGRKYKKYYPDFAIPLADGTIIIWEHLGLINQELYRNKVGEKLVAYLNGAKIEVTQLVVTFEQDVRDFKRIDEIINKRIAPYV